MSKKKKTPSQLKRELTSRLFPDAGCADSGCVFGHSGGMGTNGGCECVGQIRDFHARMTVRRLSKLAHELASMVVSGINTRKEEDDVITTSSRP